MYIAISLFEYKRNRWNPGYTSSNIPNFKHVLNGLLILKKKKLIREATLIDEI